MSKQKVGSEPLRAPSVFTDMDYVAERADATLRVILSAVDECYIG